MVTKMLLRLQDSVLADDITAEGIEDALVAASELAHHGADDDARMLWWALYGMASMANTSEPTNGWASEVGLALRRARVLHR